MYKAYPRYLTDEKLAEVAADPNCSNSKECLEVLAGRAERAEAERIRRERVCAELRDNPFDPRNEVSADARQIVKHLWIIFVALPFVLGILFVILK